ncbi:MAG: purine-nucleoside phosphorylase, partial [Blastocatellia bacterium]|nr:purine-nucleoside phosphorylase [Blastocatellia bacterium]
MSYDLAAEAAKYIKSQSASFPDVAIVLGSGLGAFAEQVENKVVVPYGEIPGFPVSTVEGHAGQLVLGEIDGVA